MRNVTMKYLRTSDLARAVGVHPNTVRRYVDWGLLPPVDRAPNGYRRFTQHHLDCLRIAHAIFSSPHAGRSFRQSARRIIDSAVANDWDEALENAHAHLNFVRAERAQAETAATLLEQWAAGNFNTPPQPPMQIKQVAQQLNVSIDVLHNWELNGFITVPRNPTNGYRIYGTTELSRLRVIRLLTRAGFSQMAILRMLLQLDRGLTTDLRHALDTPAPDEDVYVTSDRWLTTLAGQEQVAQHLLALVQSIIAAK